MSKNLLIIYAGHTGVDKTKINKQIGSTAQIALWLQAGAEKVPGVNVTVMRAEDIKDVSVLNKADGYLLGSGVYNGNPEPSFIEFSDNVLLAGKSTDPNKVQLANKPFGVFCTSAGYATGAQPVLNAMARVFMTFSAIYVGGNSWHTGQGLCGMVKDHNTFPPSYSWDPVSKYLKDDACDYGKRLALVTSFYNNSYNNAVGKNGGYDTCDPPRKENFSYSYGVDAPDKSCTIPIVILSVVAFLLLVALIMVYRSKKR